MIISWLFQINILKYALQAFTKSTTESLQSSATANYIYLYIKNALRRTKRHTTSGPTFFDSCVWVLFRNPI